MANKFQFDNDIKLDILGEEFSLDSSDPVLIEALERFAREGEEVADKFKNDKSKSDAEALMEMAKYCTVVIDEILGEGSSARIFKDTRITFFKAINVINYIQGEIASGTDKIINKYSPNRAKRRSK